MDYRQCWTFLTPITTLIELLYKILPSYVCIDFCFVEPKFEISGNYNQQFVVVVVVVVVCLILINLNFVSIASLWRSVCSFCHGPSI